jgi:type VI secretion system secreted protein VgrG
MFAEQVDGMRRTHVGAAYHTVLGNYDALVGLNRDVRVNAEKQVRLVAGESLVLSCGDSSIELAPGGVTISAKKSGSVELDDKTTKIIGPMVQINPDLSKPNGNGKEDENEMVPFSIRMTDENFRPYSNKKYSLAVEELRFEGQTDGDGWVRHEIPKDSRLANVDSWLDKYPTGAKRSYPVRLCDLAPATDVSGAQTRLKNLGYYEGAGGGTAIDSETATALRWSQRDHKLEETGSRIEIGGDGPPP